MPVLNGLVSLHPCAKGTIYHVFLVATLMTMCTMAINQYDFLEWLREGRLHKFTQMGLKLVCVYLQSTGLFQSESLEESIN